MNDKASCDNETNHCSIQSLEDIEELLPILKSLQEKILSQIKASSGHLQYSASTEPTEEQNPETSFYSLYPETDSMNAYFIDLSDILPPPPPIDCSVKEKIFSELRAEREKAKQYMKAATLPAGSAPAIRLKAKQLLH